MPHAVPKVDRDNSAQSATPPSPKEVFKPVFKTVLEEVSLKEALSLVKTVLKVPGLLKACFKTVLRVPRLPFKPVLRQFRRSLGGSEACFF